MHRNFKKGLLVGLLVHSIIILISLWVTSTNVLMPKYLTIMTILFISLIWGLVNTFNLAFEKTRKLHLGMIVVNSIWFIFYLISIFIQFQELNTE